MTIKHGTEVEPSIDFSQSTWLEPGASSTTLGEGIDELTDADPAPDPVPTCSGLLCPRPPKALWDLLEVPEQMVSFQDDQNIELRLPRETNLRRLTYLLEVYQLLSGRHIIRKAYYSSTGILYSYVCRKEESCPFCFQFEKAGQTISRDPVVTLINDDDMETTEEIQSPQHRRQTCHVCLQDCAWPGDFNDDLEASVGSSHPLLPQEFVLTQGLGCAIVCKYLLMQSFNMEYEQRHPNTIAALIEEGGGSEIESERWKRRVREELGLEMNEKRWKAALLFYNGVHGSEDVLAMSCYEFWAGKCFQRRQRSPFAFPARNEGDSQIAALAKGLWSIIWRPLVCVLMITCFYLLVILIGGIIFLVIPAMIISHAVGGLPRKKALMEKYEQEGVARVGHVSDRYIIQNDDSKHYYVDVVYYEEDGTCVMRTYRDSERRVGRDGREGPFDEDTVELLVLPGRPLSGYPKARINSQDNSFSLGRRWLTLCFGVLVGAVYVSLVGVYAAIGMISAAVVAVVLSAIVILNIFAFFITEKQGRQRAKKGESIL